MSEGVREDEGQKNAMIHMREEPSEEGGREGGVYAGRWCVCVVRTQRERV